MVLFRGALAGPGGEARTEEFRSLLLAGATVKAPAIGSRLVVTFAVGGATSCAEGVVFPAAGWLAGCGLDVQLVPHHQLHVTATRLRAWTSIVLASASSGAFGFIEVTFFSSFCFFLLFFFFLFFSSFLLLFSS